MSLFCIFVGVRFGFGFGLGGERQREKRLGGARQKKRQTKKKRQKAEENRDGQKVERGKRQKRTTMEDKPLDKHSSFALCPSPHEPSD